MMLKSPFTASLAQVATYLLGVAAFSISFLVFLNSSVSFVVTDLIGQKHNVGDAVGTLGFADELVVLVAAPLWGAASDRLGLRWVATLGYAIVGVSLLVFVQARNVYPQLLLARLLFSVGAAATSTMVTAILPTMTSKVAASGHERLTHSVDVDYDEEPSSPLSSEATMTPRRYRSPAPVPASRQTVPTRSASSQVAGLVGMFTGLGALVALGLFLPLPVRFQNAGASPAKAITDSFYVVGAISLIIASLCYLGLSQLNGEQGKGWKVLIGSSYPKRADEVHESDNLNRTVFVPYSKALVASLRLGFTDVAIGLGYLGGFVARASSVGITLFIPLYVNAYFLSSGLCDGTPSSDPSDIKSQCREAYILAATLSGSSQAVALIGAPLFGYFDGKLKRFNIPVLVGAASGIAGYVSFAQLQSPRYKSEDGSPVVFFIMALLGLSQISAIVTSLSSLGRGINGIDVSDDGGADRQHDDGHEGSIPMAKLKGSIAGVYSFFGGAGILLLTKLGGSLFDKLSPGAPFYMLAIFNGILFAAALASGVVEEIRRSRRGITL